MTIRPTNMLDEKRKQERDGEQSISMSAEHQELSMPQATEKMLRNLSNGSRANC